MPAAYSLLLCLGILRGVAFSLSGCWAGGTHHVLPNVAQIVRPVAAPRRTQNEPKPTNDKSNKGGNNNSNTNGYTVTMPLTADE